MKVLICGSRDWDNKRSIEKVIKDLPHGSIVIAGAAPGADSIAEELALQYGHAVVSCPAKWDIYGNSAGPKRNIEMLEKKPEIVYAFPKTKHSIGTFHTIREARKRGIPTIVHGEE